ncbi:hemerythrin domain-containing protein [Noviherbaspirillum denitrificans]|uniref:Hemerythrin n=1 Tax=Noviherbaspirillum denitrificans TaxID=1968433 RepID=A0A254TF67_9BURK|nr:hemerythrin domain-containing protein [Noviherbaspirillum denitrificans]OWW20797.1 hemerythrin [Noviherbaspirillum denitrificans]
MEAIRIISDEHQALAGILHAIRFMLRKVAAGELAPDLKLFQAMVHYLDAYAEKRHHPKEDILFAVLAKRTDEGADAIARIEAQHGDAPRRIARLEQALAAFGNDAGRLEEFITAFNHYADFYRGHMMLEEDLVMPLARVYLTPEDWASVNRQFRAEMEANSGKDGKSEDFAGMFSRLVECAPAPVGLGPRPY